MTFGRRPPVLTVTSSATFPILFIVLAWVVLTSWPASTATALDPQSLMLLPIGRPVPTFTVPPIDDEQPGFSSADLDGDVTMVNVFASWCGPCREEHPVLLDLAQRGVPIYGLNYKDDARAARRWLDTLGNPYRRTGADRDGDVADGLDLYGLPQTLVIDRDGTIAYVHVGAMTEEDVSETIMPAVERLRAAGP